MNENVLFADRFSVKVAVKMEIKKSSGNVNHQNS